jgi:hypothetical protein
MKKITRDILEQLWRDPANWKSGLIYYCQGDPRVIVPRRPKWRGWTINFAHRCSLPALLIITLIVGLPLFFFSDIWLGWDLDLVGCPDNHSDRRLSRLLVLGFSRQVHGSLISCCEHLQVQSRPFDQNENNNIKIAESRPFPLVCRG